MKRLALGIAALLLGAASGCGKPMLTPQETESATRDFREHYQRKEFGQLYASAAPELRAGASEMTFVAAMSNISQKLGAWQSGRQIGASPVVGEDEKIVFQYRSQFTKGEATENFVWRRDADRPILVGYHINSRALGL
jgi:hypothetical protein